MSSSEQVDTVDYETFAYSTHTGVDLTMLASYQLLDGREMVEIIEAVDEWGYDHFAALAPHEYEDARLLALSLFHARNESSL